MVDDDGAISAVLAPATNPDPCSKLASETPVPRAVSTSAGAEMPKVAGLPAAFTTPRTVPIRSGSFEMGVGHTPLPLDLCTNSYHRCTAKANDPTGCGKINGDYVSCCSFSICVHALSPT